MTEHGNLNINNTVFIDNIGQPPAIDGGTPGVTKGLFHIKTGNIIVNNGTFKRNKVRHGGIFSTDDSSNIQLINNRYIDNMMPIIVSGVLNNANIEQSRFFNNYPWDAKMNMIEGKNVNAMYSTFADNDRAC